jgi:hypothetical protein
VQYAVHRKDASGSYVKVISFPKIEGCKIIKGIGSIPFFDNLLQFAKVYAKEVLEGCTRTGSFKVTNLTFANSAFLSYFPDGDYKSFAKLYDDIDSNIFNITIDTLSSH